MAASSLGNDLLDPKPAPNGLGSPRAFVIFRSEKFKDSIAFVVYTARRIAAGYEKHRITRTQFRFIMR